jgi:hypothetical protein
MGLFDRLHGKPIFLESREERKLGLLLQLSESQIRSLLGQNYPARVARIKKPRSVHSLFLAQMLERLCHQRTQEEMAEKLEVSVKTIQRWVRTKKFSTGRYQKIEAAILGMLKPEKKSPNVR